MNKQEYLDQISAPAPAPKYSLPSFLSSKFFWLIVSAVVIFIILACIGAALSGSKTTIQDRVTELIIQLDDFDETISEYQSSLRSSTLRGYSASLSTILSSTSSSLTTFATDNYKYNPKKVPKKLQDNVGAHFTELNDELFSAKINGNLDEIFDLKMVYEISLLATSEKTIIESTQNSSLREILTNSYDSLDKLYDNFDQFTVGM